MNTPTSNPEDAKLRELLRESRSAPELPPRFQEAVWHRIEQAEAESTRPNSWFERWLAPWLRPQWVAITLSLFLLAGVISGARAGKERATREAQMRYAAAVNPFIKH